MKAVIIGAGGQARVIIDILKERKVAELIGIIDNFTKAGEAIQGFPILGPFNDMPELIKQHGIDTAIIGVGDNKRRNEYYAKLKKMGLPLMNIIHHSASIASDVKMGEGNVICRESTICTGASIGDNNIINTAAIIDHDTVIGSHVSINPGVNIAGKVTIDDFAYIGIGATIIHFLKIGKNATIGAGAVVINDIEPDITAVGVPCKPIKKNGKRIEK